MDQCAFDFDAPRAVAPIAAPVVEPVQVAALPTPQRKRRTRTPVTVAHHVEPATVAAPSIGTLAARVKAWLWRRRDMPSKFWELQDAFEDIEASELDMVTREYETTDDMGRTVYAWKR